MKMQPIKKYLKYNLKPMKTETVRKLKNLEYAEHIGK